MNCKTGLITKVLTSMETHLDNEQMKMLKDKLSSVLYNYSISEIESTELCTSDGTATIALFEYFRMGKLSSGKNIHTIDQYWRVVQQLCNMTHKELHLITEEDVVKFLVDYKQIYHVSDSTMESKRKYLSSVFSYLTKHRKIKENPMDLVDRVNYKKTVKEPLTDEEVERVKVACKDNKRNIAMIQFMLDTGVRVSELCGISIHDLDFKNYRCKVLGKGNKERVVSFSGKCAVRLQEYLQTRSDLNFGLYGATSDSFKPLFAVANSTGKRLGKSGVETVVRNLGKASGINTLTPHSCRRTCATNLSKKGVDINIIAKYLGHSGLGSIGHYVLMDNDYVLNTVQNNTAN